MASRDQGDSSSSDDEAITEWMQGRGSHPGGQPDLGRQVSELSDGSASAGPGVLNGGGGGGGQSLDDIVAPMTRATSSNERRARRSAENAEQMGPGFSKSDYDAVRLVAQRQLDERQLEKARATGLPVPAAASAEGATSDLERRIQDAHDTNGGHIDSRRSSTALARRASFRRTISKRQASLRGGGLSRGISNVGSPGQGSPAGHGPSTAMSGQKAEGSSIVPSAGRRESLSAALATRRHSFRGETAGRAGEHMLAATRRQTSKLGRVPHGGDQRFAMAARQKSRLETEHLSPGNPGQPKRRSNSFGDALSLAGETSASVASARLVANGGGTDSPSVASVNDDDAESFAGSLGAGMASPGASTSRVTPLTPEHMMAMDSPEKLAESPTTAAHNDLLAAAEAQDMVDIADQQGDLDVDMIEQLAAANAERNNMAWKDLKETLSRRRSLAKRVKKKTILQRVMDPIQRLAQKSPFSTDRRKSQGNVVPVMPPGRRGRRNSAQMKSEIHRRLMNHFRVRKLSTAMPGDMGGNGGRMGGNGDSQDDDEGDVKRDIANKLRGTHILSFNSPYIRTFELFIMVLVVMQAVYIPFMLSFPIVDDVGRRTFLRCVDYIFMFDLCLQFNIARMQHGVLLSRRKDIAKAYVRFWFWIDLLACFPFEDVLKAAGINVAGTRGIGLVKLARLPRLLRLLKMHRLMQALQINQDIQRWLMYSKYSHLLRLGRLVGAMFLFMHIFTCIWHVVAGRDNDGAMLYWKLHEDSWVVSYVRDGVSMGISSEDWNDTSYHIEDGTYTRYVTTLAIVVRMVVGGELDAMTDAEKVWGAVFTMMGGILMAIIYGNVAVLITSFYAEAAVYHKKMEYLWDGMQRMNLPKEVQKRIYKYYDYLHDSHGSLDGKINRFIHELSLNLSSEVLLYLRIELITSVPFFQMCSPEVVHALIMNLEDLLYLPKDYVVVKGEVGDQMFFIREGQCKVTTTQDTVDAVAKKVEKAKMRHLVDAESEDHAELEIQNEQVIRTLNKGSYFGEIALLLSVKRTANVRAETFTELCVLTRKCYDKITLKYRDDREIIEYFITSCYEEVVSEANIGETGGGELSDQAIRMMELSNQQQDAPPMRKPPMQPDSSPNSYRPPSADPPRGSAHSEDDARPHDAGRPPRPDGPPHGRSEANGEETSGKSRLSRQGSRMSRGDSQPSVGSTPGSVDDVEALAIYMDERFADMDNRINDKLSGMMTGFEEILRRVVPGTEAAPAAKASAHPGASVPMPWMTSSESSSPAPPKSKSLFGGASPAMSSSPAPPNSKSLFGGASPAMSAQSSLVVSPSSEAGRELKADPPRKSESAMAAAPGKADSPRMGEPVEETKASPAPLAAAPSPSMSPAAPAARMAAAAMSSAAATAAAEIARRASQISIGGGGAGRPSIASGDDAMLAAVVAVRKKSQLSKSMMDEVRNAAEKVKQDMKKSDTGDAAKKTIAAADAESTQRKSVDM